MEFAVHQIKIINHQHVILIVVGMDVAIGIAIVNRRYIGGGINVDVPPDKPVRVVWVRRYGLPRHFAQGDQFSLDEFNELALIRQIRPNSYPTVLDFAVAFFICTPINIGRVVGRTLSDRPLDYFG